LWGEQEGNIDFPIDDVFFLNASTGWIVANEFFFVGSTILKTTNGGINWNLSTYPDTTILLRTIFFNDSLNGWMGGFGGVFLKTSDGGSNWTRCDVDTNFLSTLPVTNFAFYNRNYGFAGGGQIDLAGMIWRTTNNGGLWESAIVSPEPVYGIHVFDSLNIVGTGGDFEYGTHLVTTTNGGTNWTYRSLKLFGQGMTIEYRTANEVWIPQSFSQTWAYSSNAGRDWTTFPTPDSTAILDVEFADSLHGWCVGEKGLIAKYDASSVGIVNGNEVSQVFYSLYQNYPNPFNPSTVIGYYLPKASRVELKIFNVIGQEIRKLEIGLKDRGQHNLSFEAGNLPAGVYFYTLEAGDFKETKKMVIVK
jgi:photosystem II stability/assembly factor-like uncharacterized protein